MARATIFLLSLCTALLALHPAAFAAKRVAFVVGIDAYDNLPAGEQLQKAVNDARALGSAMKDLGYQVIEAKNADRRGFNESWQQFLSAIEPGDEVAFFFAGHGIEIAGQNYLLPRDVPKPESGEAALVKNESLSVTQLLADLEEEEPRVSLVILDACRDNPFAAEGTRSVGGTRGLARVEAPEGSFVMYSAGTGQAALDRLSDNDENSNSVFTRSLVPLIKTPGLPLQEVALRVREQVVALANSVGHKQTPAYYDQVIGRFCPAGCEGGAQEAVAPVPRPAPQVAVAPAPLPAPQGAPAAICALKDAVYHTAKADADSLTFAASASQESVTGADILLTVQSSGQEYRFDLVGENGTGKQYAILIGQGDNEDPPSSEVISVKDGKEQQGIASLDDPAPELDPSTQSAGCLSQGEWRSFGGRLCPERNALAAKLSRASGRESRVSSSASGFRRHPRRRLQSMESERIEALSLSRRRDAPVLLRRTRSRCCRAGRHTGDIAVRRPQGRFKLRGHGLRFLEQMRGRILPDQRHPLG